MNASSRLRSLRRELVQPEAVLGGDVADAGGVHAGDEQRAVTVRGDRAVRPLEERAVSFIASGETTRTWVFAAAIRELATLMSARRRPRPITSTWSAVSSISLIRWLETRIVRPSEASCLSSVRTQSTPSGSRPLAGSSNSSVSGVAQQRRGDAQPLVHTE